VTYTVVSQVTAPSGSVRTTVALANGRHLTVTTPKRESTAAGIEAAVAAALATEPVPPPSGS
jgi:hypothetical protein